MVAWLPLVETLFGILASVAYLAESPNPAPWPAQAQPWAALEACLSLRQQLREHNAALRQHNQLLRHCLVAANPPPQPPSLQPAPPQLADREEGAAMLQMMANASELRVPAPSPAPSSST